MKQHWLVRTSTIRLLWLIFIAVLAITVIVGLFVGSHGHFHLDGSFGFYAWYGFATCIIMIVVAKLLGRLLHRKDSYYDRD